MGGGKLEVAGFRLRPFTDTPLSIFDVILGLVPRIQPRSEN